MKHAGLLCGLLACVAPAWADAPRRIVSLAPNLTEIAYAAGAGPALVGTVEYSDYPSAARQLPRVGDAWRVDMERVLALHPDLVLAADWWSAESILSLRDMGVPVFVCQFVLIWNSSKESIKLI